MNDQSQKMNQPPPQMLNQMMSQPPPPQIQMMAQSQAQQSQMMMMNQSKQQQQPLPMMNRGYNKVWPVQASLDYPNKKKFQSPSSLKPNYVSGLKPGRSNWKGKTSDKRKDPRRLEKPMPVQMPMPMPIPNTAMNGPSSSGGGYKPPALHELQSQNRLKARKFYQKKKYNNRFAPYAPRNTTSFIIRAKKAGGIAELVSPCPVTPAVLPTPIFSPSREVLGDTAKEEWGVDGYGSMKGLIRLRSPGNEHDEEEEDENGGSSDSDVEEHVEVERRLDHDLSRFEMIYPNYSGVEYNNVLENRVDDQDSHIAQLEEENLTLKERLFLMERELGDLRRRLQFLERQNQVVVDMNEEVVENGSENESEGGSDAPASMGCENNVDMMEYVSGSGAKGRNADDDIDGASDNEAVGAVCMEEFEERNEIVTKQVIADGKNTECGEIVKENVIKDEETRTDFVTDEVIAVKNEEPRNESVPDEAEIAKEKEKEFKVETVTYDLASKDVMASVNDGTRMKMARNEIAEKNEFTNEEQRNVCSEKSIGDGD
ncbi:hypothetical protein I3843_13G148600 [Carya illinoinensis]|nr:hypothetical protein I3843_13G148600 [Carya illinoinensis]KAG7951076.1 hypothetical protein I3843_13G148600 [Carya illinoinensis]